MNMLKSSLKGIGIIAVLLALNFFYFIGGTGVTEGELEDLKDRVKSVKNYQVKEEVKKSIKRSRNIVETREAHLYDYVTLKDIRSKNIEQTLKRKGIKIYNYQRGVKGLVKKGNNKTATLSLKTIPFEEFKLVIKVGSRYGFNPKRTDKGKIHSIIINKGLKDETMFIGKDISNPNIRSRSAKTKIQKLFVDTESSINTIGTRNDVVIRISKKKNKPTFIQGGGANIKTTIENIKTVHIENFEIKEIQYQEMGAGIKSLI